MATGCIVRHNEFYDSVFLMRVAHKMGQEPGVRQAVALMGTEKNKLMLGDIQVSSPDFDTATPNDLMVAVVADAVATVRAVLDRLDEWMRPEQSPAGSAPRPRTLDAALAQQPASNLAVISLPGQYAAREARNALEHGLNVFLFSSNVSVEDERALKEYARAQGLIVMGPDCGTGIIGGIGLGFANAVRRGSIGVIGASGTGTQEFTSLVHGWGVGISHAIGIGTRDFSDAIGGISALSALQALERDPGTNVIAVISKPPGAQTLSRFVERISACTVPVVTCFLGIQDPLPGAAVHFRQARHVDEAARLAFQIATGHAPPAQLVPTAPDAPLAPGRKFIRGIFAGGTFCYQAQQVLADLGIKVHSNAPLNGSRPLADPRRSMEHTLVDMGDEFFTDGRPHPMIDATLRRERILAEIADPSVAVLLVDFILGYNASPDPVGDLVGALARARERNIAVVASVCGTEGDSQGLRKQVRALEDIGVCVLPSSAAAAEYSGRLVLGRR